MHEFQSKLLEVKKAIKVIDDDEYALLKHNLHITLSYDSGKKKILLDQKEWLENMIAKIPPVKKENQSE